MPYINQLIDLTNLFLFVIDAIKQMCSRLPPPESALRELVDQLTETWNAGDAAGYAALFWDNADYIAVEGTHLQDRGAIAKAHRALFDTRFKGSRLQGRILSCRFVAPTVAIVHHVGSIQMPGAPAVMAGNEVSIQTLVAVEQNREWRFAAFQNTVRRMPAAQPTDPIHSQ